MITLETENATIKKEATANPLTPCVKLSPVNVPVFDGSYLGWASFHDVFSALIHVNVNLSPIQKFFYLRSSLSGEALNAIKCLETTTNNYEKAWSIR